MIKMDTYCESGLIVGGLWLRVSGLDELPQLWNVLRGEMSLVGPRPCLPSEYAWYSTPQKERFSGLPGLTGYWQVNGKNALSFHEMNAMDVYYVRHASILMDLHIMLRTPAALLVQTAILFRHQFDVIRSLRCQGFICGANQECAQRGYKKPL
jgi:lipopolysaccharide/colanic/teichoic acid biosynthesis glycosyltransferase